MDTRTAFSAETRRRILEATHRSLARGDDPDLGLHAIARVARVSRRTIYNHFGSRSGLLEALYDYLAARGHLGRGKGALLQNDPDVVVATFIRALVDFWSSDPVVIRRLHAMAALDAEIARGLAAREKRRRRAAAEIVRRSAAAAKRERRLWTDRLLADALSTLASFETYDVLARAGHGREDIIAVMTHLARSVLVMMSKIGKRGRSRLRVGMPLAL
jgi:AcrR family transcriptional regulator